jgi:formylglycine-generating enzyme required for sulfatase activity
MSKFKIMVIVAWVSVAFSLGLLMNSGLGADQSPLKEAAAKSDQPGSPGSLKDPYTGMEFVFIKGGCYEMGNIFGESGDADSIQGKGDEKPIHTVCVDDFYLGKYEVTQGQWEKVMQNNPSDFKKGNDYPVEQVSWEDAQEFIKKLNEETGRNFRLPTEAEWEYAARSGGKREKYAGTNVEDELDQYAWYSANADLQTHPVGQKKPNGLGLYDMIGNVAEWCSDWYDEHYYKNSSEKDPTGPESGTYRVLRGNSWLTYWNEARSSARSKSTPTIRINFNGLRLCFSAR